MVERGERQKPGEASGGNSRTRQPLNKPKLADLGVCDFLLRAVRQR